MPMGLAPLLPALAIKKCRRSDPASPRLTNPALAATTTSPLSDMFHHLVVCG
jgi:hypothetical protein